MNVSDVDSTQIPWPAYVLAGGRSTRLGQDKARVLVDEETTLLERVVSSLDGLFPSWTVVADEAGKFSDLQLRTIADEVCHRGPLGGILAASEDAGSEYFFVVSCDRVGLKRRWARRLAVIVDADEPVAATFCFQGRREPLFGFYQTRLADHIRDALSRRQFSVSKFLDAIDAPCIEAPPQWGQTFSINTPEDLARLTSSGGD